MDRPVFQNDDYDAAMKDPMPAMMLGFAASATGLPFMSYYSAKRAWGYAKRRMRAQSYDSL